MATSQVKDQPEIARTADIQQAILNLEPNTDHVPRFRDGEMRKIAIIPNWAKQRESWNRLVR